ncbi:MAG: NAD(P)H-hydrate dehydratase [Rhodospirillaceae bacterium]|jgi:NAD(P)H-hydrate epimerase|nr:NAD(P)H-hydrate dehydratase [Rhodospirillaceae bacterium]MBT4770979.1 NAD(P)H-hydrate dehydratase [Rhodospirillaceae bacterium]MBT5359226.1 NAD(P)H-hydrate dehydratase [Rhodospirillaceae bacterium]MBT5769096.1 NAD(P)H-hydrate dehydratase [Rhodospirillaceae bacterium]MBT6310553.1 NAD(P)H-hydrate dehydratase [Rhodospirillaceae bacterium]
MTTRWSHDATELLTVAQMYRADAAAVDHGVSSLELMERAGAAIADALDARWPRGHVLVLCGPGNNGGDGFVAARLLTERGRDVALGLLGEIDDLAGDAAVNAARWVKECDGEVDALSPEWVRWSDVVVDGLFGAGLTRPIEGVALKIINEINDYAKPCLAIDVPSGVHGDSGAVLGAAPKADLTVTFFRHKPGHLLFPGRGLCAQVRVADIGISDEVLEDIHPTQSRNVPMFWASDFPRPDAEGHKYGRGHAIVAGGGELTGAAQLAAYAALRSGAGLVSIASPPEAVAIYRSGRPSIMVRDTIDTAAFAAAVSDPRVRAVLVGPGNGVTSGTRANVLAALDGAHACVIDADGISVFADNPEALFERVRGRAADTVLTPHAGEFDRLFGKTSGEGHTDVGGGADTMDRLGRARAAAALSGAVVVLKGADTVIAAPDGRAAINDNAPPTLATAGSGDVLAGLILGLLAQGMPGFSASCAGVWMHGAAAERFGPGLIADDIADCLPQVLKSLYADLGLEGVPNTTF